MGIFNKKLNNDVRVQILNYINNSDGSINKEPINKFLSQLKNQTTKSVVNGLIELIDEEYIIEYNHQVIKGIVIGKSPVSLNVKRFVEFVKVNNVISHDAHIIKFINISITLKGKKFLIEDSNLSKVSRNLKYESLIRFGFLFIGAGITLLANYISNKETPIIIENQIQVEEMLQESNDNLSTE